MTMADTVAVMNGGRVEQLGAPSDLYENPGSTFVANFLGTSNLIEAQVAEATGAELLVMTGDTKLRLPAARCSAGVGMGGRVLVGVRPEKVSLAHAADAAAVAEGRNRIPGRIVDTSFIGVSTQYVVESPAAGQLTVYQQNVERDSRLAPGAAVVLHWNPDHTFGLDAAQSALDGTADADGEAA